MRCSAQGIKGLGFFLNFGTEEGAVSPPPYM